MASSRFIVLFTRSPVAEAQAKRLPLAQGARLFWALLDSWQRAAAAAGSELLVVAPESAVDELEGRLTGEGVSVEGQRGARFGERLSEAAGRAFARGAKAALLVGCDSPAPPLPVLDRAFAALESDRPPVVLAPSHDGGVNLIGLARWLPELLSPIVQGSSSVERSLSSAAWQLGLDVVLLPSGPDLDRIADISRAYGISAAAPCWRPFRVLLRAILTASPLSRRASFRPARPLSLAALFSRAPPAA